MAKPTFPTKPAASEVSPNLLPDALDQSTAETPEPVFEPSSSLLPKSESPSDPNIVFLGVLRFLLRFIQAQVSPSYRAPEVLQDNQASADVHLATLDRMFGEEK